MSNEPTPEAPAQGGTQVKPKFGTPEKAYKAARRAIINNALRRRQKSLDLSGYGLNRLPPEIGRLTALQHLLLNDNQLSMLPPEIGQLAALELLSL